MVDVSSHNEPSFSGAELAQSEGSNSFYSEVERLGRRSASLLEQHSGMLLTGLAILPVALPETVGAVKTAEQLADVGMASEESAGALRLSAAPALLDATADSAGIPFRSSAKIFVRDWKPEDADQISSVAERLGLDKFYEGGKTRVLEAEGHGVVGYSQLIPGWTRTFEGETKTYPGNVEILGVLPEFRNRSSLLLKALLNDMREIGGTWKTSAFDDTSGRLMTYLERKNLIQIVDRWGSVSGRGMHPITHYTFKALPLG